MRVEAPRSRTAPGLTRRLGDRFAAGQAQRARGEAADEALATFKEPPDS